MECTVKKMDAGVKWFLAGGQSTGTTRRTSKLPPFQSHHRPCLIIKMSWRNIHRGANGVSKTHMV